LKEATLIRLKDKDKYTYNQIAEILGTTVSSVKHKYVRINQKNNDDRHHHPEEKIDQIKNVLGDKQNLKILETNAGFGNLTKVYSNYGEVIAQDIDKARVDFLESLNLPNVTAIKCDSFNYQFKRVYEKEKYDVIDLDPYGFPSRYFPSVFEMINDGWLFVTFPKLGVQQINKIMVEHYRVFWGIHIDEKDTYKAKIINKIVDYGFQCKREVELINVLELDRMYRFLFKVDKASMLDLVGLEVNRG